MKPMSASRRVLLGIGFCILALVAGGAVRIAQDQCGPFTDVTPGFCPYVLELYYLGITVGTSATTFSPDQPLTRGQAAVFVAKGLNQSLARSSRRATLGQWWTTTPAYALGLGVTPIGVGGLLSAADGESIWVANQVDGTVTRIRASDGKPIETWTGASQAAGVLVAMGRVLITGQTFPGHLYMIDPSASVGAVTTVASDLGNASFGLTFDGSRIWVANNVNGVSIVTPSASLPWPSTTVTAGLVTPAGAVFDGTNVWITDNSAASLLRYDSAGNVLQIVAVGQGPVHPAFDGANIWVPNGYDNTVTVVNASTGAVVQTLSGNGLNSPDSIAFDGQRILVTNIMGDSVSLWKAADLSPIGTATTGPGTQPFAVCSDGVNFWITLRGTQQLARY